MTLDERHIYIAVLEDAQAGEFEGCLLPSPVLLVRRTLDDRSQVGSLSAGLPPDYREAFGDCLTRKAGGRGIDISGLTLPNVRLVDGVYFESGACTVGFSPVGFSATRQKAVTFMTYGCKGDSNYTRELLIGLSRSGRRWEATAYAVLSQGQ